MCSAPKIKTAPPPAGPPPIPTRSAAEVSAPPEAGNSEAAKAKRKRTGRASLRSDIQIPGGGAGLMIPVV